MPGYVAGWNIPGYMPESEPVEFDTFEEARDYIVSEIENDEECADVHVTEAQEQTEPFEVYTREYVYWVTPAEE